MRLGDLIEGTGCQVISPSHGEAFVTRICDFTEDSRTVLPGALFVARKGFKIDASRFISDAIHAGASAVLTDTSVPPESLAGSRVVHLQAENLPLALALLAERFFGYPSRKLKLIGVTGTNGKTSVVTYIHRLLNLNAIRTGMISTVSIDDGASVSTSSMTTPPAAELSHTFARMVEAGCQAAVIEVSSHSLQQQRVAALQFDIAIFTNLSGDHLDYHTDMDQYASAKAMLFESLGKDALAIINSDDPVGDRMLRSCHSRVIKTSTSRHADANALILSSTMEGIDATLQGPRGSLRARSPIIGDHNIHNLLQAVLAVQEFGVAAERIEKSITLLEPAPGRLERVDDPRLQLDFAVFVDYAHTDDALDKVLRALRPLLAQNGRLCIVFGCGGDRDRTKRPRMGQVAVHGADHVIITSDNSRSESADTIIAEIISGIPDGLRRKVTIDADRASAINRAVTGATPGDIILIAGKGHETYQIISDGTGNCVRIDFDDRAVARDALSARFTQRTSPCAIDRSGARA